MVRALIGKLLRDVRLALGVVVTLLVAFQFLWANVTRRVVGEILKRLDELGVPLEEVRKIIFENSGQIIQTLIGGDSIELDRAQDMMSISYVHPLTQTMLCLWAVGRAAGALAGELDRGTMELLLAQPIRRIQLMAAHLAVDAVVLPILALAMWLGTWLGVATFGLARPPMNVDVVRFAPALACVVALAFAVSGQTMVVSALGRSRGKALGYGALLVLVQFLVNVIGQLWKPLEPLRTLTVFEHYQPQPIIVGTATALTWMQIPILIAVGIAGYALAAWIFCRRDLPAPL